MQMARSTYDGAKKHLKGNRPFILNRAGYSGVQRYTATWTGDNVADSEHMICGVRLVNSLGLSGVAFAGFDVGGFAGDPSADLFVKWTVLGAFSPLFRFHSMINSKDAEPWSFGEEAEEISRNYISLRYRLMPYIYSAFYESSKTGMPISRSLVIDYANDDKIYESRYQNQYLFGGSFMIPPIAAGLEFIKVYLPLQNSWYDLHTGLTVSGGEHIAEVRKERYPIFVKGSSIIPMQSLIQNLGEYPDTTLEVHVYNGKEKNTFELYEDDGVSYDYERENYFTRSIEFDPLRQQIQFVAAKGKYETHFKTVKLYFHGFDILASVKLDGKMKEIQVEDYQYIAPVSSFDPFYKVDIKDMTNKAVPFIEFVNTNNEITITF
jgi:alpha-glucosidase